MTGRAGVAPPPPKVSPPQKFARAAEAAGWTVERAKRTTPGGVVRRVVATRNDGVETFRFEWVRNATTGRDNFAQGERVVLGFHEDWSNVAAAQREIEGPFIAWSVVDHDGEKHLLRLPFDIDTADDDTVLRELSAQPVEWRNRISGGVESATAPALTSKHFRIEQDGEPRDRIVHLTDETLEKNHVVGRFRSFRLSQLLGVAS